MLTNSVSNSITVVTSSIGRPELAQCIESVKNQAYPGIRHMVYVNGAKYHQNASKILNKYPEVTAFYLPDETGDYGAGGSMADVFAASAFLTRSDWLFFLDDDNFYDPNHVGSLMTLIKENDLKWAYSLRRYVNKDGDAICDDNWCSLGYWPVIADHRWNLIDNSCYAVSLPLAKICSLAWTAAPYVGDRCFFGALHKTKTKAGCTGLSTVNYRVGSGSGADPSELLISEAKAKQLYPNGFPWRKPAVYE